MSTPPATPSRDGAFAPPLSADEAKADVLARFSDQGPGHINCAQTVLRFSLLVTGSDPSSIGLARQFGGGLAGTGETCGAITGAALALSLRDLLGGEAADPGASRKSLQELVQAFAAEFGAVRCRDLTGHDLTTPQGHIAFVSSGGSELCQGFVAWVCDRLRPLVEPGS